MLIECRANAGHALPAECLDERRGFTMETIFPVTVGQRYAVFAITIHLAFAWYYILDDDDLPYPVWSPAPLFDVVDPTIPAGWEYGYYRFENGDQYPLISFPDWARDRSFYERLVDGDPSATVAFDAWRNN